MRKRSGFFAAQWIGFVVALVAGLGLSSIGQAQPDYPPALWNQAYPGHWYTSGNGHYFCVIHDMEGYYEATISYFQQPTQGGTNSFASIYYCVNGIYNGKDTAHSHTGDTPADGLAGEITQMVREQYWAWHVLCWNTYMFGTEHEGFVDSPVWYTEAMYQASAGLQRHLCSNYGIPMDRNHIIGHNEWQNATWTNWMATNWPQIDTTCNNHTDPGQYWNWTHFMALVTSNTPTLAQQPYNRAVQQGSNATFSVFAGGVTPLTYHWYFNGNIITGATKSAYTVSNAQPTNAGNYSIVISNSAGAATSSVAALTVSPTVTWYTAFSDNFETASSATNWNLFTSGTNYTTNWAFDYTSATYSFNGTNMTIPVAPGTTNGTKLGLKITVNKNSATGVATGLSLYPKGQTYSSNYALQFDMWMNYAGGSGGGTGSTEYSTYGINHTGTRVNWGGGSASASDGVWFTADGEGGATTDYLAYVGNPSGNPTVLSFAASGLGANGATTNDAAIEPTYYPIFPLPNYETPNSPGKHWVQGEVNQINGVVTWKLNGVVVAQRTNTSSFTSGDVMLGYMDIFASLSSPLADTYVIYDNVRVLAQAIAPAITQQPTNLLVNAGGNATFTASASGTPPPTYQWYFGSTLINGATNSSYVKTNAQPSDVGNYSVKASNVVTTVTSSNAALSVTTIQLSAPQYVDGQLQFTVAGAPGPGYTILTSSNLVDWVTLAVFTNTNGTFNFTNAVDPNNFEEFYRVSAAP